MRSCLIRSCPAILAVLLTGLALSAQSPAPLPNPPHIDWHASWIAHPTAPLREPVVLHFRRALTLDAAPASYPVFVSADNRFVLCVNGQREGDGPARGDLAHWRYERFDLAPLLKPGSNLITATVWNFGIYAPIAQISDRTAFLLDSVAQGSAGISTPEGWEVEVEPGQRVIPRIANGFWAYMAAGTGEELDASKFDWDWQNPAVHGPAWDKPASPIRESIYESSGSAASAGATDAPNSWALVPDALPHMEHTTTSPGKVVRVNQSKGEAVSGEPGILAVQVQAGQSEAWGFPVNPVQIPLGSHIQILLDRKSLTTAYPRLVFSGGKGAKIHLTYAEALYDKDQHKGDRDSLEFTDEKGARQDRVALGISDTILPDGGQHRIFEPLWWRTWRYLDIDIETAAEPLILESLTANFTAYPFAEKASFAAASPESDPALSADLAKIWEISWRTARLDAHETYMDTPYYEQLQYIGDTRIQALISYAVANDDRLALQAIRAFDQSRIPEGITRSRYPSSLPQNIPTFSLLWIGMVHDSWMYRPDNSGFINSMLPGTRAVLGWFAAHQQPDGLLRQLPYWTFIDWVSSGTIPTYSTGGESCITSLEYLGALGEATDLEQALGDPALAERYRTQAKTVRSDLANACWAPQRGLVADNPDQKNFSQQANILAVLYDVVPKDRQREVLAKVLQIDPGTTPDGVLSASYYFRFYLARALEHAGMSDAYLDSLSPWRKLLPLHFSTWPEVPGDTRSDSHAWTAHPIYDLLTLVAGIQPDSPGFKTVRIAPHPGSLPSLSAAFPHPEGLITVEYKREGTGLTATITLPGKLGGEFVYQEKNWPLHPGVNRVDTR
jgi:hypothetical protein